MAIEGYLGLCRYAQLELRASVCRSWHAAAPESNASAAIVCDSMRACNIAVIGIGGPRSYIGPTVELASDLWCSEHIIIMYYQVV